TVNERRSKVLMRSPPLTLGGIAGGLTLAFALTACSAMGQTSADSSDGGNQAASTSSTAEPENARATENSASATAPPQDLQTIGKHPSGEYEDSKVVLNSVTASGGTLTVQFSLENNSAEEEIQIGDLFANGVNDAASEQYESPEQFSVDEIGRAHV